MISLPTSLLKMTPIIMTHNDDDSIKYLHYRSGTVGSQYYKFFVH